MKEVEEKIVLDGVAIEVEAADLDKDGKTGGTEVVRQNFDKGIQAVIQPSELGDSLKELHNDTLDYDTRMSGIDMRANLVSFEASSLLALDALVALGVLPTRCLAFSRQKKRLSKSIDAMGSKQIVELVAGKREQDLKASGFGMMDKAKGFMGMNR